MGSSLRRASTLKPGRISVASSALDVAVGVVASGALDPPVMRSNAVAACIGRAGGAEGEAATIAPGEGVGRRSTFGG